MIRCKWSYKEILYVMIVLAMIVASGGNLYIRSIYFFAGTTILLFLSNKKINTNYFAVGTIVIVYIILNSMIFNTAKTDYKELVLFCVRILCCVIVASLIQMNKFKYYFLRIMVFLATMSLFFYLLILMGIDLPGARYDAGVYGTFYHTIGYGNEFGAIIRRRNCGIFTEPGVFQMYLNIALIVLMKENEIDARNFKLYFGVLSLALISSRSSMGYLVYVLVLMIYYFEADDQLKKIGLTSIKMRGMLFGIIVIILAAIEISTGILNNFIVNTNSFDSRRDDLLLTFLIASDYPIFGIGLSTNPLQIWDEYYYRYSHLRIYKGYQNAMSCGLGNILAMGGIPFGIYYAIHIIKYFINFLRYKHKISSIFIVMIAILFMLEEPLLPTPFFLMAFFWGTNKYKGHIIDD